MKINTAIIIAHCSFIFLIAPSYCMENRTIMHNKGISDGEKTFLKNRRPIVKTSLEEVLKKELKEHQIPNISLTGSGGGYRATFCTAGSVNAASKMGLLNCITYMTCLSGSTWFAAPWIATGKPLYALKPYLQSCAAKPFIELTLEEKLLIAADIATKMANNQKLTMVDFYGNLLANRFLEALGSKRQEVTFSEQAEKIESGKYPYLICTAIDGSEQIVTGQRWYEFTPHTIGDRTTNMHIPTTAYGKKFENGAITNNNAPEKPLGYLMGTWGSAFGANVYEILKEVLGNNDLFKKLLEILPDDIEADRVLPFFAKVANYFYHMDELQDSTLSNKKHMKFVDAGLEINLPYPPVSGICPERKADILIFIDASAGQVGEELRKVADYAQAHQLPFPTINFDDIGKKTISIFKDENDLSKPVVIYLPRISDPALWEMHKNDPNFAPYKLSGFDLDKATNEGPCQTQYFQYTDDLSSLVMNQMEFNMLVNEKAILDAIDWWVSKR